MSATATSKSTIDDNALFKKGIYLTNSILERDSCKSLLIKIKIFSDN